MMADASDIEYLHRRAASYVDRLLRGAKVSELPFERPTKFELVINLKTAKTLGPRRAACAACSRRRSDRIKLFCCGA
jgi:ABC-type uncharacterized transport system substrate-binding protein